MTKPRPFATAALLLTMAALIVAGCGSGTANNAGTAASQAPADGAPASATTAAASPAPAATGTYRDQIMAWGRRFAACARAHGIANFPDPVYPPDVGPNGPRETGLFPDRQWGVDFLFTVNDKGGLGRATEACWDLVQQMPPAPDSLRPPNAQEMAVYRRFAACMRAHGFADFPDPKADGTFPINNGPYASLQPPFHNVPRALDNAYLACATNHNMPMYAS